MWEKILVAFDGSLQAERAVTIAGDLAQKYGSELTIINVYDERIYEEINRKLPKIAYESNVEKSSMRPIDEFIRDAEKIAESGAEILKNMKVDVKVNTVGRLGDPAKEIVEYAKEGNFQLIIVGYRGITGVKRYLMGSVSRKVVEHSPCCTLVTKVK
jgi:nucleotide-binding universal stress UspA family protein